MQWVHLKFTCNPWKFLVNFKKKNFWLVCIVLKLEISTCYSNFWDFSWHQSYIVSPHINLVLLHFTIQKIEHKQFCFPCGIFTMPLNKIVDFFQMSISFTFFYFSEFLVILLCFSLHVFAFPFVSCQCLTISCLR